MKRISLPGGLKVVVKATALSSGRQPLVRVTRTEREITVSVPEAVHRIDQTGPKHIVVGYGLGGLQSIALIAIGQTPKVVKECIDSYDNTLTLFDVRGAVGIVGLADRKDAPEDPHMVEIWKLDGGACPMGSWAPDDETCVIEAGAFLDEERIEIRWYTAGDPRTKKTILDLNGRVIETLEAAPAGAKTPGSGVGPGLGASKRAAIRPYGLGGGRWRPPKIVPNEYVKGVIYDPERPNEKPCGGAADRLATSVCWRMDIDFTACVGDFDKSTREAVQRAIRLLVDELKWAHVSLNEPLVAPGLRPVPLGQVDPLKLAARVLGMERCGWIFFRGGAEDDAGHPATVLVLRTRVQVTFPPERYQSLERLVADCAKFVSGLKFGSLQIVIGVNGFDSLAILRHPKMAEFHQLSRIERGVGLGQTVLSAIGPGWRISERQQALIAGWRSRFGGVKESGGAAFVLPPAFPQWRPKTAAFSALGKLAEYSDAANKLVTKAHPNDKERRAFFKAIAASRARS